MELAAGTRVADRYVVERSLAKGGMGAVYVAKDTLMGDRVALKVTAAGGAGGDELRRRFAREARIGNRLGKGRVGFVRASNWGQLDAVQLWLVMDLIDGGRPLDLRSGTQEERLARWRKAAELVRVAHEAGVLHRDLKPANFLQAPDGRVYLTDFGLAKVLPGPGGGADEGAEPDEPEHQASLTNSGIGFGTPPYMPPEQLEDAKRVDERADVYALGCMLFEALAGRLPYPGPTPTAVARAHAAVEAGKHAAPTPRASDAGVDPVLDAACAFALELDAARRCPSVATLLAALDGQAATRFEGSGEAPRGAEPPARDGPAPPTGPPSVGAGTPALEPAGGAGATGAGASGGPSQVAAASVGPLVTHGAGSAPARPVVTLGAGPTRSATPELATLGRAATATPIGARDDGAAGARATGPLAALPTDEPSPAAGEAFAPGVSRAAPATGARATGPAARVDPLDVARGRVAAGPRSGGHAPPPGLVTNLPTGDGVPTRAPRAPSSAAPEPAAAPATLGPQDAAGPGRAAAAAVGLLLVTGVAVAANVAGLRDRLVRITGGAPRPVTEAPPATEAPATEAPPAAEAPPATEVPPVTEVPPATEAPPTPAVVDLVPADGAVVPEPILDLRGRLVGFPPGTRVRVHGTSCPVEADGAFVARRLGLEPGANRVELEVRPPEGEPLRRTLALVVDPEDPVLTLDGPAEGLETTAAEVTLRGRIADASATEISLVGGLSEAQTEYRIVVQEGSVKEIRRQADASTVERLDASAPGHALIELLSEGRRGESIKGASVVVNQRLPVAFGDRSKNAAISVLYDSGAPDVVLARLPAGGGPFSVAAPVAALGRRALELVVRDAAGRTARATRAVVRRALVLEVPADDLDTSAPRLRVSGRVTLGRHGPLDVRVSVDGGEPLAVRVADDGAFDQALPTALAEGERALEVVASGPGPAGEPVEVRVMRRLRADRTAPVVRITAPAEGAVVDGAVEVRAEVTDAAAWVDVSVNGGATTRVRRGQTFATRVALAAGATELHLVALDPAGSRGEVRRQVTPGAATPWPGGPPRLPAGVERGPKAGEYLNRKDGSLLVYVAPGTFRMGSDAGGSDEKPVHEVRLTRGYLVGKTEVTWAQYRAFCKATGRQAPSNEIDYKGKSTASDDHPVFNVSWDDAQAYCAWAGVRLPTEAEWEYAARGSDGRTYPWGNQEPGTTRCNLGSGSSDDYRNGADGHLYTAPVGSFPAGASLCGALDLAGNVWEWVEDWYADSYPAGPLTDPTGPTTGTYRALRGGSWFDGPSCCRAAYRNGSSPTYRSNDLGFRVARSSEDP